LNYSSISQFLQKVKVKLDNTKTHAMTIRGDTSRPTIFLKQLNPHSLPNQLTTSPIQSTPSETTINYRHFRSLHDPVQNDIDKPKYSLELKYSFRYCEDLLTMQELRPQSLIRRTKLNINFPFHSVYRARHKRNRYALDSRHT